MTVVLATTAPSQKTVGDENLLLTPFVGSNGPGPYCSFGVGFLREDKTAHLWGLLSPHLLIRSWRAMKLFARATIVTDGTLCRCWYAASDKIHDSDQHWVQELQQEFGGQDKFVPIRAEVLAAWPGREELEKMLRGAAENKIEFMHYELPEIEVAKQRAGYPGEALQVALDEAKKAHEVLGRAIERAQQLTMN